MYWFVCVGFHCSDSSKKVKIKIGLRRRPPNRQNRQTANTAKPPKPQKQPNRKFGGFGGFGGLAVWRFGGLAVSNGIGGLGGFFEVWLVWDGLDWFGGLAVWRYWRFVRCWRFGGLQRFWRSLVKINFGGLRRFGGWLSVVCYVLAVWCVLRFHCNGSCEEREDQNRFETVWPPNRQTAKTAKPPKPPNHQNRQNRRFGGLAVLAVLAVWRFGGLAAYVSNLFWSSLSSKNRCFET